MLIRIDDLTGPKTIGLIQEHLAGMFSETPPESVHALNLDGLRQPEITFWSAWDGDEVMGCGALKDLGEGHGELKSMRTARGYLRKGVAKAILLHILDEARHRGFRRLSLETGSQEAFIPARTLYANAGFTECGPFADYTEDPYSVYMTLELA